MESVLQETADCYKGIDLMLKKEMSLRLRAFGGYSGCSDSTYFVDENERVAEFIKNGLRAPPYITGDTLSEALKNLSSFALAILNIESESSDLKETQNPLDAIISKPRSNYNLIGFKEDGSIRLELHFRQYETSLPVIGVKKPTFREAYEVIKFIEIPKKLEELLNLAIRVKEILE